MSTGIGILLSAVAAICLAVTAVCIRLGTDDGRSIDALIVVLFVNILTFLPLSIALYHPDYSLTVRSMLAFIGAGLVGTMLGRAFFFQGIVRIGASRAEPIKGSMPLHSSIIAVLVLQETVSVGHAAGILLIVLGIVMISWESKHGSEQEEIDSTWFDFAFPVTAAVLFGIDPIFAKVGFEEGTPVLVGLAIKTLSATVGFLAYLRWRGTFSIPDLKNVGSTKWYIAGGVMNSLFLLTSYAAYEIVSVSLAVPIVQMSPVLVTLLSYVFLQDLEQVNRKLITGILVVVTGAVLVTVFGP